MKHIHRNGAKDGAGKLSTLLLALTFVISGSGFAQGTTSVEIAKGKVILNGKVLDRSQYPQSLDANELNMSFSFVGETSPVIEIMRKYYSIGQDRLVEVSDATLDAQNFNIFLTSEDAQQERIRSAFSKELVGLQLKAAEMKKYSSEESSIDHEELATILEAAQENANAVVVMASQLPRLDTQGYWNEVRSQDNELYSRFNREWSMEQSAQEMALRARSMAKGYEKDALVAELRETLEQIFVIKQENRNREIVQLQDQLLALENNMKEREKYKAEIIERRLKALLGQQ